MLPIVGGLPTRPANYVAGHHANASAVTSVHSRDATSGAFCLQPGVFQCHACSQALCTQMSHTSISTCKWVSILQGRGCALHVQLGGTRPCRTIVLAFSGALAHAHAKNPSQTTVDEKIRARVQHLPRQAALGRKAAPATAPEPADSDSDVSSSASEDVPLPGVPPQW